jgi:hypothetical protein
MTGRPAVPEVAIGSDILERLPGKASRRRAPLRRVKPTLAALVLAVALWPTASRIRDPIDGEHYFRQTHVAANIDKYVSDGLSLRPRTYNEDAPLSVFDFPVYQLGVATLCRFLGTDPLVTARAVSLVLLVLTLLVLDLLMVRTRVPPVHRLFALIFCAFSPLNLYFFHTPLVDCLAIFASLLSLLTFVCWREAEGWPRRAAFLLLLASGVIATLIKNPVYLPVFVTILWLSFKMYRSSEGRRAELVVFVLAIALSVLAFKLYSNVENGLSGFISSGEMSQYFGALTDRLSIDEWRPLAGTLAKRAVGPLGFGLALVGVGLHYYSRRGPRRDLYLGLLVGMIVTIVVFLPQYRWHSYYQLPTVFPLAFFAGSAVASARRLAAHLGRRFGRGWGKALPALALLSVVGITASESGSLAFQPSWKRGRSTERLVVAGEWIRLETNAEDFIAYIVDDLENWNPAYLYFAKRDGYNLHAYQIASLPTLRQLYGGGHRRFLVFCPADRVEELSPRLEAIGASQVGLGPSGTLFCLRDVESLSGGLELPGPPSARRGAGEGESERSNEG